MNKLREMAVVIICLVPLLVLILNPSFFFPTPAYYAAGFTTTMAVWLFAFANFDFVHVQKHIKGWTSSGSAQIEKMGSMDLVYLGPQSVRAKKIVVNLQEMSPKTKFLGRWTVYTSEYQNVTIELWHDHYIFGSQWYYIQY